MLPFTIFNSVLIGFLLKNVFNVTFDIAGHLKESINLLSLQVNHTLKDSHFDFNDDIIDI